MKSAIYKILFNGGLTKEEYKEVMPDIHESNRKELALIGAIAAFSFAMMALGTILLPQFDLSTMHVVVVILCVLINVTTRSKLGDNPRIILVCMYMFRVILYGFSFSLLINVPDKPSVTTISLLLFIPQLFTDRPIRKISMTGIAVIIFFFISYRYKAADMAVEDFWNGIVFGSVAIIIEVLVTRVKIDNIAQKRRIRFLSETDLLTETKNRNCFEKFIKESGTIHRQPFACVYADVNGLHALNDSKGHEEGDRMIKFIATQIKKQFGYDFTFRVGGDEFISFTTGYTEEKIAELIQNIINDCREKGYSVSVGYALYESNVEDMIQKAETNMYAAKRKFYTSEGNDRRKR